MLERRSALASAAPYASAKLVIAERPGFSLTQLAGPEKSIAAVTGPLPEKVAQAQVNGEHTIFRTGPAQFWLIGPERDETPARLEGHCAVTPLSHSRVRIALSGSPARAVLAKLMPVDFHASVFKPGGVALTGLHHTPVTVHCTREDSFDVYAMRTFALNVWEVVTDAALEFC
ncbi:sarcosine oxidase subunit gamma [Aestuariivirga sp.]|uniref:sarcosine oxidase subunit gamma n=1 Tax=Aestuariivirga sp. TaxID=2650926 RepID=UPI00391D4B93